MTNGDNYIGVWGGFPDHLIVPNVAGLATNIDESDAGGKKEVTPQLKRPMNAFMCWSSVQRKKMMVENPGMHNSEISKHLGKQWKDLDDDAKKPYQEQSKKLRETHAQEHPDYKYMPRRKAKNQNKQNIEPMNTNRQSPNHFNSSMPPSSVPPAPYPANLQYTMPPASSVPSQYPAYSGVYSSYPRYGNLYTNQLPPFGISSSGTNLYPDQLYFGCAPFSDKL